MARWTIRRYHTHPLVVIVASAVVLIGSTSAILMQVEPATFSNLTDSVWFCIETMFTVGYGDITPKTPVGRIVATGLILSGVALAGAFIKMVSNRLPGKEVEETEKLAKQVEETNRLVQELVEQQRIGNQLNQQLLDEMKRQAPKQ
jgi:voltage-gated potassium channel